MTGWFALFLIVAVVVATAAIFAAGRKAGAATEAAKAQRAELKSQKEASDAKGRMIEAGAAAPFGRLCLPPRRHRQSAHRIMNPKVGAVLYDAKGAVPNGHLEEPASDGRQSVMMA